MRTNKYLKLAEKYGCHLATPYLGAPDHTDVYIYGHYNHDMITLHVKQKCMVTYDDNNGYKPIRHPLTLLSLEQMIKDIKKEMEQKK